MGSESPAVAAVAHVRPLVRKLDLRVLLPAMVLVVLGLAAIASDKPVLFGAQLRWWGIGLVALLSVVLVPYPKLLRLAWPLYGLSIVLLLLVLIPGIGVERNGGRRWLSLAGVSFQPSELTKVAHVLVLASYIRFRKDQRTFRGLLVPFALTVVPMALILKQPDLGTALMMVPVLFALLWVAGARTKHLLVVVLLGVASMPVIYPVLAPHQKARLRGFAAALVRSAGDGETTDAAAKAKPGRKRRASRVDTFQLDESLAAVAGGGFFGQGWRKGRQNTLDRVPYSYADFIFTVHAEEWGFLGVALLLGAEGALLLGLAFVAKELREPAGRLLAVGAMVLFGVQATVNLGMAVGLAPITGLPLPFLSYGGSAMLMSWVLLGLALNAKAREPVVFATGDFE